MTEVNKSRRVLLICNDAIGQNMAGPGIRYWEFARVLSQYFTVTLAVPPFVRQEPITQPPFPTTVKHCQKEQELYGLARDTEVIVTVGNVVLAYPNLIRMNKPLVLDIYIPSLVENLHIYSDTNPTHQELFLHEKERASLNTQLRSADFLICASERQRDYWLGLLTTLGRINPYTHSDDKTLRRLIDVVPFGLPSEKAVHHKHVLKGVYRGIGPDDYVLIWSGGIWEWLDAPTLIKAMPLVLQKQPNVKLFFMGIKRPNRSPSRIVGVNEAIELSKELGLYDTHIFFNDWVPYDERQNYFLEADLGVSLYRNHIETRFSFRTRFIDHLWTGLPLLATEGDVMSTELVRLNLGRTVKAGDVAGVARTIVDMLRDKEIRRAYQANFEQVVATYCWKNVTRPLVRFCAEPYFAPDKAYLQTVPIIEIGPTPYWKLPLKAWQTFRSNGMDGFLWQLKKYILWKQGRQENE